MDLRIRNFRVKTLCFSDSVFFLLRISPPLFPSFPFNLLCKYRLTNSLVKEVSVGFRVIKSRRSRWPGHVARMEEVRSTFNILTGTPTGNRPWGRPRRRWENNIRMYLEEIGISTRKWVDSALEGIIGEPLWMRHWTSGFHKPLVSLTYREEIFRKA